MEYTRIHRLLRLITLVQGSARLNAAKLAEIFQTTERNVYRDIQNLEVAGVPISYDEEKRGYLAELNKRYTCVARDKADAHRAVDPQVKLDQVLCEQERRVVGRDWCVRWKNQHLQIDKRHESLALPGKPVLVKQKRDGTVLVEHAGELLEYQTVTSRPEPPRRPKPVIKNNKKWKPPATHPWKQGLPPPAAAAGG